MIIEKSFLQINHEATEAFIKATAFRYKTEAESNAAANGYSHGRISAVGDLEAFVEKYNHLIRENNKLKAELDANKNIKPSAISSIEDLGL